MKHTWQGILRNYRRPIASVLVLAMVLGMLPLYTLRTTAEGEPLVEEDGLVASLTVMKNSVTVYSYGSGSTISEDLYNTLNTEQEYYTLAYQRGDEVPISPEEFDGLNEEDRAGYYTIYQRLPSAPTVYSVTEYNELTEVEKELYNELSTNTYTYMPHVQLGDSPLDATDYTLTWTGVSADKSGEGLSGEETAQAEIEYQGAILSVSADADDAEVGEGTTITWGWETDAPYVRAENGKVSLSFRLEENCGLAETADLVLKRGEEPPVTDLLADMHGETSEYTVEVDEADIPDGSYVLKIVGTNLPTISYVVD